MDVDTSTYVFRDGSKVAIEAHGEGQSKSEVTEELVLPPGWQKCEGD